MGEEEMIDQEAEDLIVKLCIKSYIKGLTYAADTLIKSMDALGINHLTKAQLLEAQSLFETQDMNKMMETYRQMVKDMTKK